MQKMIAYSEVLEASRNTVAKLLHLTGIRVAALRVNARGGNTAQVGWRKASAGYQIELRLPSLPINAMLPRAKADEMLGYLLHEMAHVIYSEQDGMARVKHDKVLGYLVNALEDVRIERALIDAGNVPGAKDLFEIVMQDHVAKCGADFRADELMKALYAVCVLGRVANGYNLPVAARWLDGVPAELSRLVHDAVAGVAHCKSTSDVIALAERLLGTLPKREGGEGGEGDREGNPQKGEAGNDVSGKGADGSTRTGTAPDTPEPSIESWGKELAKDHGEDQRTFIGGEELSRGWTAAPEAVTRGDILSYATPDYIARVEGLVTNTAAVKDRIRRLVRARAEVKRTRNEESGRFDIRSVLRARAGATAIYQRKTTTPAVETSVLMLCDYSGSMGTHGSSRCVAVKALALQLGRAIEAAGAELLIEAFEPETMDMDPGPQGTAPISVRFTVHKDWRERMASCAPRIVSAYGCGGTAIAPGVWFGTDQLLARRADRRLMLVLSDGTDNYNEVLMHAAVGRAERAGIEVAGIGIYDHDLRRTKAIKHCVTLTDLQTGLPALLDLIANSLERARLRGAA